MAERAKVATPQSVRERVYGAGAHTREQRGAAAGHSYLCTVARVRGRSSRVPICLLTVERAAPTAEMDEKGFDQKWSGHGHPSHYGSDALVNHQAVTVI